MKSLKISLIQFDIAWQKKEENLSLLTEKIKKLDTQVIVLPEMFNTGFNILPHNLAENSDGITFRWMKNIAAETGSAICGSIIWQEKQKFYNRFIFMQPNGNWAYYDKRHSFSMAEENKYFSPGNTRVVINYNGWKIKPLICYDLRFPVWARNTEDYDLLIYVANWPSSRIDQWEKLLMARSIENQAYVVAVNRIGIDGNNFHYSGKSMVLSPKGEIIYLAPENSLAIYTIELDKEVLMKMRKKFPVLKDRDDFNIIDSDYREFP